MYTKQLALQQQLWTIATTALLERAQAATERVTLIAIWAKVGTLIISDFRFVMAARRRRRSLCYYLQVLEMSCHRSSSEENTFLATSGQGWLVACFLKYPYFSSFSPYSGRHMDCG
jgi:hypothetical protein